MHWRSFFILSLVAAAAVSLVSSTKQFKFKTRYVDGRKIAVLTLNYDQERDRRSILMADGEDSAHRPAAFGRYFRKFIPPFDDDIPINRSLSKLEDEETKLLEEIEASLKIVKEDLEEEKKIVLLESASLTKTSRDGSKRGASKKLKKKKQKRRERIKRDRKKRRKQRRKEKALMRKKNSKKNRPKLIGADACHYKTLRRCAKKLKLLPRKDVPVMTDFIKCSQRKKFLECVETRMTSRRKTCEPDFMTRGNLPGLRSYIKKLFWTVNSCLLNEALKGK